MKSFKCSLLKCLYLISLVCSGYGGVLFAQDDMNFHIIPEVTQSEMSSGQAAIQEIGNKPGKVMSTYRQQASQMDLKQQIATGIMNWNTILQYLIYLTRFVSQIGLFIGALMIIFAGYKYATNVFGGKTNEGNTAIKYAIIGVLVISFSYAIMKFFTSLFLGS